MGCGNFSLRPNEEDKSSSVAPLLPGNQPGACQGRGLCGSRPSEGRQKKIKKKKIINLSDS